MKYFEDMVVGTKSRFGRHVVTREDILDFASKYDPQPFHLSDEEAAKTHFGRIAASGWHTAGMAMRMIVDNFTNDQVASLGGIGVDELRWLKPVYPGDVLSIESELLDKKESKSRPEMGIFRTKTTVLNQNDEPVLVYTTIAMVATRPA